MRAQTSETSCPKVRSGENETSQIAYLRDRREHRILFFDHTDVREQFLYAKLLQADGFIDNPSDRAQRKLTLLRSTNEPPHHAGCCYRIPGTKIAFTTRRHDTCGDSLVEGAFGGSGMACGRKRAMAQTAI